mmetsp:Transcript_10412/g.18784  ORF Transcript_10412/g.18784 Transcript_10412/m.18784 type:complete len:140 (-) Transcript_10412:2470-2889(-)
MGSRFIAALLGRTVSSHLKSHCVLAHQRSLVSFGSSGTTFGWYKNRSFCDSSRVNDEKGSITVNFVLRNGEKVPIQAKIGDSILEVAHRNNVELEGACEGSLACSTCHVYVDEEHFSKLEEPTDDENDMLDLAFGLAEK